MSQDLPPGARLPTTQQLMEQHHVTNQTVQRALAVLKDEGFLVGRAGLGVFVREETPLAIEPAAYIAPNGPDHAARWISEAARRRQRGSTTLLEVTSVIPPAAVAQKLQLDTSTRALLRKQVLLLDDEPVELAWIYLPLGIVTGTELTRRKLIRGGIPRLLADLGYPAVEWEDQLSVRLPTTEEFTVLQLPADVPVLRTFRVVYAAGGVPIEASVLIKGGHRYELSYRQRVE